jgi:hypothetical protein
VSESGGVIAGYDHQHQSPDTHCPAPFPLQVFSTMAQHKADLRVMDWGVANATLEEVFIKFARQIGAKTNEMS